MTIQRAKAIVRKYIAIVKKHHIPVESVYIFGSQVKRTAHPWSDIDTCVVSEVFGKDRHSERVALMHLTDRETQDIEPHPFHPKDLEDKYDPLAAEIRRFGVKVV